jgi:hypothetical protein
LVKPLSGFKKLIRGMLEKGIPWGGRREQSSPLQAAPADGLIFVLHGTAVGG